jgi:hypothetical protein
MISGHTRASAWRPTKGSKMLQTNPSPAESGKICSVEVEENREENSEK